MDHGINAVLNQYPAAFYRHWFAPFCVAPYTAHKSNSELQFKPYHKVENDRFVGNCFSRQQKAFVIRRERRAGHMLLVMRKQLDPALTRGYDPVHFLQRSFQQFDCVEMGFAELEFVVLAVAHFDVVRSPPPTTIGQLPISFLIRCRYDRKAKTKYERRTRNPKSET